jgi:hypothetical protein
LHQAWGSLLKDPEPLPADVRFGRRILETRIHPARGGEESGCERRLAAASIQQEVEVLANGRPVELGSSSRMSLFRLLLRVD